MKAFLVLFLIFFTLATQSTSDSGHQFEDSRDGNLYPYVKLGELYWFTENLRFQKPNSISVQDSTGQQKKCGEFYKAADAFSVCPKGWRLPTEKEVKQLLTLHKRKKIDLNESLNLSLCGRIDNGKLAKVGDQNTFWINAEMKGEAITHWHTFGDKHELHSHNVVQAQRQFPLRCVCETLP